jgi:dihydrofolate reductase
MPMPAWMLRPMFAFGGKADMAGCGNPLSRSLLGVKRTWAVAPHMSAFDPKRPFRKREPIGRSGWKADLWLLITPTARRADCVHNVDSSYSEEPGWRFCSMAKLVFGMNQSLDGYVDHLECGQAPALFRHWIEHVRDLTGSVYGRRMYEAMRYWDEDRPEWGAKQHEFAAAWRRQPKWVVSRSLKSVGPNATLVEDDIEAVIRGLKARLVGEIAVSGPDLARSVTDLGLIDEYRLYFRPVVLGRGKPFFAGPRPPLRLVANDLIGEDAIRLTYVPA